MKVVICGASGFVGTYLIPYFKNLGYTCVLIERQDFYLGSERLMQLLHGANVVINLVGASIDGRWTKNNKNLIYDSRIINTRALVSAMKHLEKKPDLFISASAVGIYDHLKIHDESSTSFADDFLGLLCKDWEKEARSLQKEIRTVTLRTALVLGKDGGFLKKMKPIFKSGMGAVMGNGKQAFPWIHMNDYIRAVDFIIENKLLVGPVNMVSPGVSSNREFSILFGKALRRPVFFSIPPLILSLVLGEQSDLVLKGQKAVPKALLENGFVFQFPDLAGALLNLK